MNDRGDTVTLYICKKMCGRLFKTYIERDIHENDCDESYIPFSEIIEKIRSHDSESN